jgi:DNA polymerase-3 subunit epsilon
MIVCAFDTETTGLPLWSEPSEDPRQPHLCQFTAVMFDDQSGEETEYVDMIIKPDGWTIPAELTAIHGISQERALEEGVAEIDAARRFYKMALSAERVTGYNVDFDIRILRIAMKRAGLGDETLDKFAAMLKAKKHDVMRLCTPVCKLPPTDKMMATGRKGFKSPSLTEAVKIILKEDLGDAHDARVDVLATIRLYQHFNPLKAA